MARQGIPAIFVAMLLMAFCGTRAVRKEIDARAVEPCHQYARWAVHSRETTRGSREGCKCMFSNEKVFCDDNPKAVLGRKFLIGEDPPCEGIMYCAVKASTTTTTTAATEEYTGGFNCALYVEGAEEAEESSNPKMCKCSGTDEKVFCRAELEPFAEGLFELPSGKSSCESALYCAVKSKGAPDAAFAEGDFVFYRSSEGKQTTSRVVKVHREVYPAFYTISIGGVERQTEESRLEAAPAWPEQETLKKEVEDDEDEVQIAPGLPERPAVPDLAPTREDDFSTEYGCRADSQGPAHTAYKFSKDATQADCGRQCHADLKCVAFDFTYDEGSGHLRAHDGSGWVHDACRLYDQIVRRDGGGWGKRTHCIKYIDI